MLETEAFLDSDTLLALELFFAQFCDKVNTPRRLRFQVQLIRNLNGAMMRILFFLLVLQYCTSSSQLSSPRSGFLNKYVLGGNSPTSGGSGGSSREWSDARSNIATRARRLTMSSPMHSSTSTIPRATPRIIIAGAPAAGKGTQCEQIKEQFGVVHLSTGDLLRAAVKEGTPLGIQAKKFMESGELVPDELITGVVCDRLRQEDCLTKGWLLDGFPRTKNQAEALTEAGMVPDCFILLDVPEEVLVERVTGRRIDPSTGKIYHMTFNPPPSDIVPRLVQRSDDTAEKIVTRYREFQQHVDAVKSSYVDKLVWVDGSLSQDTVSRVLMKALADTIADSGDKKEIDQQ